MMRMTRYSYDTLLTFRGDIRIHRDIGTLAEFGDSGQEDIRTHFALCWPLIFFEVDATEKNRKRKKFNNISSKNLTTDEHVRYLRFFPLTEGQDQGSEHKNPK